jgi:hypothetical protein
MVIENIESVVVGGLAVSSYASTFAFKLPFCSHVREALPSDESSASTHTLPDLKKKTDGLDVALGAGESDTDF